MLLISDTNKKIILLTIFLLGFFGARQSFAVCPTNVICCPCATDCTGGLICVDGQCQESGKITFCPFSSNTTTQQLIDKISSWMMIIALVVAPLMILLGGFYMLTAAGDTKRTTKGKQIIIWASIGLAIFLFAKAFISILKSVL